MLNQLKNNSQKLRLSYPLKAQLKLDGAKLVSDSMDLGRAIGFSMENDQLLLTVDERHTGKRTGFDVLESLMEFFRLYKGNCYF